MLTLWKRLELVTRPVHPSTQRVLAERWAALPPGVQTEQQILGRHAVGCVSYGRVRILDAAALADLTTEQ